jgi:hypothetical protein
MEADLANIQASLEYLKEQLAQKDEQLASMNRLLQDRDALQRAISGLEDVLKRKSEEPYSNAMYGVRTDIPQTPLWQGAQQVLLQNGGPMTARQITEALLAGGWKIEGKTPVESVRTTLIRKPEIFDRGPDHSFVVRPNVENRRARIG